MGSPLQCGDARIGAGDRDKLTGHMKRKHAPCRHETRSERKAEKEKKKIGKRQPTLTTLIGGFIDWLILSFAAH
jgi:hypothetical protein